MTSNVVDAVRQAEAAREQQKQKNWLELVDQLASGAELSPTEIADRLAAASKSIDQLEAALKLRTQRRQWIEQIATADSLREEQSRVNRQIVENTEQLAEAVAASRQRAAVLAADLQRVDGIISAAQDARRRLRETAPRELLDLQQKARKELARVRDQEGVFDVRATRLEEAAADLRKEAKRLAAERRVTYRDGKPVTAEALLVDAQGYDVQVEAIRKQQEPLAARAAELTAEIDQFEARMMDP